MALVCQQDNGEGGNEEETLCRVLPQAIAQGIETLTLLVAPRAPWLVTKPDTTLFKIEMSFLTVFTRFPYKKLLSDSAEHLSDGDSSRTLRTKPTSQSSWSL